MPWESGNLAYLLHWHTSWLLLSGQHLHCWSLTWFWFFLILVFCLPCLFSLGCSSFLPRSEEGHFVPKCLSVISPYYKVGLIKDITWHLVLQSYSEQEIFGAGTFTSGVRAQQPSAMRHRSWEGISGVTRGWTLPLRKKGLEKTQSLILHCLHPAVIYTCAKQVQSKG